MILHRRPKASEEAVLDIRLTLTGESVLALEAIAARRKQRPVDMLMDAVDALITDDMFDAVIDDGRETTTQEKPSC